MENEDYDTCESSLNSIMRVPPLPPELASSLTEQVEKLVLLTEKELAEADEANEMHPPLVAVFWFTCAKMMLFLVQLIMEREERRKILRLLRMVEQLKMYGKWKRDRENIAKFLRNFE